MPVVLAYLDDTIRVNEYFSRRLGFANLTPAFIVCFSQVSIVVHFDGAISTYFEDWRDPAFDSSKLLVYMIIVFLMWYIVQFHDWCIVSMGL